MDQLFQDQLEPEFELGAVVGAAIDHVFLGDFGEIGELIGGHVPKDGFDDTRSLLRRVEREIRLGQREAIDVQR